MVKRRAGPPSLPSEPVGISVADFATAYPNLYHMAEAGSWGSIERYGLRSTRALLDLFEVTGDVREQILSTRRGAKVVLSHPKYGHAVIRDNLPMLDAQLEKCLYGGLTARDWYRKLNDQVFFWVSEARLNRLLGARTYRSDAHDVLVVDTASILRTHEKGVVLSPINSGATRPAPQPRGPDTFLPLSKYPYAGWRKKRGAPGEVVVECAFSLSVPDIADHTIRVERRKANETPKAIWTRA